MAEAPTSTLEPPAGTDSRSTRFARYVPVLLIAFLGITASIVIFQVVKAREIESKLHDFAEVASSRSKALQRIVENGLEVLFSIGSLFDASENVTRQEFRTFAVNALARHPEIQAVEWLPRVSEDDRERFENSVREEGFPRFRISGTNLVQGTLDSPSSEYFPALYLEPFALNRYAMGFDNSLRPDRWEAMRQARDTGQPAASAWVTLGRLRLLGTDPQALLVFLPIFTNNLPRETADQRQASLRGFAMCALRISALLDLAMHPYSARELEVFVYDHSASREQRTLLRFGPHAASAIGLANTDILESVYAGPHWSALLDVAGRQWMFVCRPTPQFLRARRTWPEWGLLTSGLIITGLLVIYQMLAVGRATRIEQLVSERTAELGLANQDLQREVTQRKRTEEALRASETQVRLIVNEAHDAFVAIEPGGRIVEWNLEAQRMFGWAREEALGRNFSGMIISPQDRDKHSTQNLLAAGNGPSRDRLVELTALHRNGIVFPVELSISRIRFGNNELFTSFIRDITARKVAEEAIKDSEALYHSLVDTIPLSVFRKDLNGRFTFANRRCCEAFQKTIDDVLGKTDADMFPTELAEKYRRDDERVVRTGNVLHDVERHQRPDGKVIYVEVIKAPVRDSRSATVGTQGIFWDVTDRLQAEEELRRTAAELARSQEELLKALTDLRKSHQELKSAQTQLIEAEKMQSVGRLAAGVAHEVKNPLAIIRMGIDFLLKHAPPADESARLVLTDISEAIRRADSIILGLLDFSAPHALSLRPADLNQVVGESLALVRHELSAARIQLQEVLGPNIPPVPMDPNKIKQVLVNLLTNAIHAMKQGGTLTVRTASKALRGGTPEWDEGTRHGDRIRTGSRVAIIEVLDTGTGIPPETLAKVFDPFFTTKPAGKGTGLGLTVAKKIVELHGGTLDIRNREEHGVVVTVTLKI